MVFMGEQWKEATFLSLDRSGQVVSKFVTSTLIEEMEEYISVEGTLDRDGNLRFVFVLAKGEDSQISVTSRTVENGKRITKIVFKELKH